MRGFQVAPAELEGHLLDHPDVADTCVVGYPDDYSGEVPLAFVVLEAHAAQRAKSSPEEAEKIKQSISKVIFKSSLLHELMLMCPPQHVSDVKVQYKWLTGGVEFVDEIAKNPSGKLLRRVMRDKAKVLKANQLVKAKL